MSDTTFLVAGGDLRQTYMAASLAKRYRVYAVGFDKKIITSPDVRVLDSLLELESRVDCLVLPLPASNDGGTVNTPFSSLSLPLSSLPNRLIQGGLVLAGRVDDNLRRIFERAGAEVIDYFQREELAVLNAIPTAEGALQIAMEELPRTIFGCSVLVTGYGRIARTLTRALTALGAKVSVAARKYGDLAWAQIAGCESVHISELDARLGDYELVFNTVPAMVLDEAKLALLKPGCMVIDLASKPGGVDFETARRLGIKTIWALSLPGKVAPVTSGEMIADTICNILLERGEEHV